MRLWSLSARRAWIEIGLQVLCKLYLAVALRKESVDRNTIGSACTDEIEVALRKESVDRNDAGTLPYDEEKESLSARRAWIEMVSPLWNPSAKTRRSPQGERG